MWNAGEIWRFARYVVRRFIDDRGTQVGAELAYTSLLGLVPLLAMGLAVLSLFPAFGTARESVTLLLVAPLTAEAAASVREHLEAFVANAQHLTGLGAAGLAITALLLFATIENAFAVIWRVRAPRGLAFRVLAFWAVLTIGPLLVGASITISGYFQLAAEQTGVAEIAVVQAAARYLLPFLIAAAGFLLMFLGMPNRRVRLADAVVGALVAAILFEILKRGFVFYIGRNQTYRVLYGAIAILPIFLVWLYLSWCVVLLGAEVAAALPEWAAFGEAGPVGGPARRVRLVTSLAVLAHLWAGRKQGHGARPGEVERALAGKYRGVGVAVDDLVAARYLARTEGGRLLLARDLAAVPLVTLCRDLGFGWSEARPDLPESAPDWHRRLVRLLAEASAGEAEVLAVPVAGLFEAEAGCT